MNNTQKSILLLGGSLQQVVAIEEARELGYRTVLCDYLSDNPGQFVADAFYPVSTTDPDEILQIARREHVDGVLAYASDPAATTAAYVAEQLGLPTNPLRSVQTMSSKNLFREHLQARGFPCPRCITLPVGAGANEAAKACTRLSLPLAVKPTDSSGSKGITIVHDVDQLPQALAHACDFSRNGVLLAEEYINRSFPHVVGGDVFVVDGVIEFWGVMSCLRDPLAELVPVGKVMPSGLSAQQLACVKDVLQNLVASLNIRFGELNIEIILGEDGLPYVLELGARAGGNMIPVQLSDASGINLVRANVLCAMGEHPGSLSWEAGTDAYSTYVLHSMQEGVFEGVDLSEEAQSALYRTVYYVEPGHAVHCFNAANKAVGVLFMRFASEQEMHAFYDNVQHHIRLKVA